MPKGCRKSDAVASRAARLTSRAVVDGRATVRRTCPRASASGIMVRGGVRALDLLGRGVGGWVVSVTLFRKKGRHEFEFTGVGF